MLGRFRGKGSGSELPKNWAAFRSPAPFGGRGIQVYGLLAVSSTQHPIENKSKLPTSHIEGLPPRALRPVSRSPGVRNANSSRIESARGIMFATRNVSGWRACTLWGIIQRGRRSYTHRFPRPKLYTPWASGPYSIIVPLVGC